MQNKKYVNFIHFYVIVVILFVLGLFVVDKIHA